MYVHLWSYDGNSTNCSHEMLHWVVYTYNALRFPTGFLHCIPLDIFATVGMNEVTLH